MEFRWKPEEIAAPELNNDFKWRFASDMLKPKMQIEGPSVGSLLYAINPQTSELGLKQMDSELNQQLAANEQFDKRGDAAMKFMEQRVAEDIAAKQFADKMDLENFKAQNVDAGHFNSLMTNYAKAVESNDAAQIALLEDQIIRTVPNSKEFIEKGRDFAEKAKIQKSIFNEYDSKLPRGNNWANRAARDSWIITIQNDDRLTDDYKNMLIKNAYSINTQQDVREMESFKAGLTNRINKNLSHSNAQDKKTLINNYAKNNNLDLTNPKDKKIAEDWYKVNYEG